MGTVAPYLAVYARNPANWPRLRALFRANPGIADATLIALASNVATAPSVTALADPRQPAEQAGWLVPLLNTLSNAGQIAQARTIWGKATGVQPGELVHDLSFGDKVAPPPFNWSLTSSGVGLAERQVTADAFVSCSMARRTAFSPPSCCCSSRARTAFR